MVLNVFVFTFMFCKNHRTSNYKENIFSTVAIKSIRTTKSIKLLKFEKTVADVTETDEYLIVSLKGSIIFVDIYTFNIRFKVEGINLFISVCNL